MICVNTRSGGLLLHKPKDKTLYNETKDFFRVAYKSL